MNIMLKAKRFAQGWIRDEEGATSIEFVMMAPLLAWAFLSTTTYFHAYRAEAISQKASWTIADMISREADYITPDYINGARSLLRFLSIEDKNPDLRITSIRWNENKKKYIRVWSQERGPRSPLRTTDLAGLTDKLPIMSNGERAIIVETWTDYKAPRSVGLSDFDMQSFVVVSPRFVERICWNATPEQGAQTERC